MPIERRRDDKGCSVYVIESAFFYWAGTADLVADHAMGGPWIAARSVVG